jgi:hypothetical protein
MSKRQRIEKCAREQCRLVVGTLSGGIGRFEGATLERTLSRLERESARDRTDCRRWLGLKVVRPVVGRA